MPTNEKIYTCIHKNCLALRKIDRNVAQKYERKADYIRWNFDNVCYEDKRVSLWQWIVLNVRLSRSCHGIAFKKFGMLDSKENCLK